jgi:probable rRNA maturation factor
MANKTTTKAGINFYHFPKRHEAFLERAAAATLDHLRPGGKGTINFILISDGDIRRMNRRFRKVRRITDVISFSYAGNPAALRTLPPGPQQAGITGDIYIGEGRSRKQAKRIGHPWEKELAYLVIHGVLHLFGYTDYTPPARKKMFKEQDHIFACLFS